MADTNGDVLLQEILKKNEDEMWGTSPKRPEVLSEGAPTPEGAPTKPDKETHSQWALGGNGRYMPVGSTVQSLPAGIYETFATPGMWGLEQAMISSDGIYELPDMATVEVLEEVKKFWDSEERYRKHNLLYKRGLILWGPPGSGKTVAVKLLMRSLVDNGGIVVIGQQIGLLILCLKAIRRIEPDRKLIVVLEDIDEIINFNGESSVLSLLDGENNVDNVLYLATTNYPERLGARIINRPSRFDRRVHVGMPSEEARQAYLIAATNNGLTEFELSEWVADTEGMSIAHLRELVAAVYCLDQPYDDVIDRLKGMAQAIKAISDGFADSSMGFTNKPKSRR
jgi:hypothetical protein